MRFAHTKGHSNVRFVPDGSAVVTSGSDGDIRVFKDINDDDSKSHLVGEEVLALACSSNNLAFVSASGTNTVRSYTLDEGNSEALVARFTADVTCLDCDAQGKFVAAGSADMTVKVTDTASFETTVLEGHAAPVLSVTLDTKHPPEFVVSSACDGTVKVWDIEEKKSVFEWNHCHPTSNDVSKSPTLAGVKLSPNGGDKLAVARQSSVKIYNRGPTWLQVCDLKAQVDEKEFVSVIAFSPNGAHVVGGTTNGDLIVWHVATGQIAKKHASGSKFAICSVDWNPQNPSEIAFIDANGHWDVFSVESSASKPDPKAAEPANDDQLNEDELAAALFEDDDDDNENSFSIRKIKKETGFLEDGEEKPAAADIVQRVNQIEAAPTPQPEPPTFEVDIQEPFQPGSTPVHLQSRFMTWNQVGIVKSFSSEEEHSIDVKFHDSAIHHPIHLGNNDGYTMADLSREALVLANEASEDGQTASKLLCHYFGSSDVNKEWSMEMPKDEEIMAVCCGDGWVSRLFPQNMDFD